MTERKPQGMDFRSWIDQQISEAEDRGAFANLPGAGKPLPGRGRPEDPDAWALDWVRRSGVSTEELLPTPLRLRRQAALLADSVPEFGSERAVRAAVAELNDQIMQWRRLPIGPPLFVPLVDPEAMAAKWQAAQPGPADPGPADHGPADPGRPATGWRRSRRRRSGTRRR